MKKTVLSLLSLLMLTATLSTPLFTSKQVAIVEDDVVFVASIVEDDVVF